MLRSPDRSVKIVVLNSGHSYVALLLEINVQQKFGHRTHLVVKLANFSLGVLFGEWAEELFECF